MRTITEIIEHGNRPPVHTVGLGVVGAIYSSPVVVGVIVGYSVIDGIYGSFSDNNMADDMIGWRYDF